MYHCTFSSEWIAHDCLNETKYLVSRLFCRFTMLLYMSWLVHQLCPWPVTGICDFLPWMVHTFSPLSPPLTFSFLSFLRWPFLWLSNNVKVARMCFAHLKSHYLCKQVLKDVMSYPQLWKGAPSGDGPCRSATTHLFSMVLPISPLAQLQSKIHKDHRYEWW